MHIEFSQDIHLFQKSYNGLHCVELNEPGIDDHTISLPLGTIKLIEA